MIILTTSPAAGGGDASGGVGEAVVAGDAGPIVTPGVPVAMIVGIGTGVTLAAGAGPEGNMVTSILTHTNAVSTITPANRCVSKKMLNKNRRYDSIVKLINTLKVRDRETRFAPSRTYSFRGDSEMRDC